MSPALNRRAKGGVRFRLTERDISIIHAINRYRYMRTGQINRLIFQGNKSKQSCQKRLKYLFHNGFLDRIFPYIQQGVDDGETSDLAYRLDKQGVEYLRGSGEDIPYSTRNRRIKYEFLQHALDLSEFRVNLELALQDMPHIQLRLFVPDFMQKEGATGLTGLHRYRLYDEIRDPGTGEMVIFRPDAMVVLEAVRSQARRLYFVEIDRGTEGLQVIRRKIRAYQLYSRNQLFSKFGKFQDFSVLFQTSSERRTTNMVKLAGEMDFGANLFASYVKDVSEKTLLTGAIWQRSAGEPMSLLKPQVHLEDGEK